VTGDGSVPCGGDLVREALDRARADGARRRAEAADAARREESREAAGRRRAARSLGGARGGRSAGDPGDPVRLGDAVRALLADRGWEPEVAVGSVLGRWPDLVGPDIAAHCRVVRLCDGELSLQAESTAWATQVRLLSRQLLAVLAAQLGPGVVTAVRVSGPTGPGWGSGPLRVRGRGPRDTYG